jgi:N-acetylglucosamine-6-phosphate deacetylase
MRGGLFEATLFFNELTTEIIADGKHLADDLLRLAFKIKGPDALALVTDANRALDMPDGPYIFGNKDEGCAILKHDGVGLMPDGKALASSVAGMDHCVRTMHHATKAPLPEIIRMASLTPAKIAGFDKTLGSITPGKIANLLLLDQHLHVSKIFLKGFPVKVS